MLDGDSPPGQTAVQAVPLDWPRMLSEALEPGRLTSQYQPIVDVRRGTVVGYEALARFPGFTVANPETWFAAARRHGRAPALEAAALRSALASRQTLPTNAFLTVNLGHEVIGSPEVRRVLDDQPTCAGLVVELTEHARVDSYVGLEPALNQLRAMGALIAIDDAGSGYAGLQHLLGIRPSFIKLDRSLVSNVDRDEAKVALVEMMGTLSSRLDAWLLAEGVETAAELDMLARLGVPLVQGYYLARPASCWSDIDPATSLRLVSLGRQSSNRDLRTLVEPTPTCARAEDARAYFARDDVELVVVLDGYLRPSMTMDTSGLLRSMSDGLRVNLDTSVGQVAQRAITRPVGHRFDPVVVTDNAGRYVGIVRMERVLHLLARTPGPGPGPQDSDHQEAHVEQRRDEPVRVRQTGHL